MVSHQTAIRLTSQSLQMVVSHTFGIYQHARDQLPQRITPGCVREPGLRNEFSKLPHDGRLSNQRTLQTTNDFEQELDSVLASMNLNTGEGSFGSLNQSLIVVGIQKQNAA